MAIEACTRSTSDMNGDPLFHGSVKRSRPVLPSWGSGLTVVVTPPRDQRSCPPRSPSSVSDAIGGSAHDSPCSSVTCCQSSSDTSSSCVDEGTPNCRADQQQTTGCVRWSDECGGELVTQEIPTIDFWEQMVFGSACSCARETALGDGNGTGGSTEELPECIRCAELERWPGGEDSSSLSTRSELFCFVEELSRGVEATLVFPGLFKIKKRVILYTEDNGRSICWMTTGQSRGGGGWRWGRGGWRWGRGGATSEGVDCIPCKTLLAVKDKSGAAKLGTQCREQFGGDICSSSAAPTSASASVTTESSVGTVEGAGHEEAFSDGARTGDAERVGRGVETSACSVGEVTPAATTAATDSAGVEPSVAIKLKWMPKPRGSKRSVKISEVQTCLAPGMFTRGMLQLLTFNTDLQNC